MPREGGRGLEEVAGGSRGEAAAGCGQAAGQLHVVLPQHRERLRFPARGRGAEGAGAVGQAGVQGFRVLHQ